MSPKSRVKPHRRKQPVLSIRAKTMFNEIWPETLAGMLVALAIVAIVMVLFATWFWPVVLEPKISSAGDLPICLLMGLLVFVVAACLGCAAGLKLDDLLDRDRSDDGPATVVDGEVVNEDEDDDEVDDPDANPEPPAKPASRVRPTPRRRPATAEPVREPELLTHRELDEPEMKPVDPKADPTALRGYDGRAIKTTDDESDDAEAPSTGTDPSGRPSAEPPQPIQLRRRGNNGRGRR